jgi:nicotinate-nucleotide pyrophosphorylase (carboxylating)
VRVSSAPVQELIDRALAEDLGSGDRTSEAVVGGAALARARIDQRAEGVVAGIRVAEAVFRTVDPDLRWHTHVEEGVWREGGLVAEVAGSARSILAGERVALNFLGRLSGIATLTARYVRAVDGTGVRILDTRKTTPGLRALEKQAVLTGGGHNHRTGLFDAVLVKENHAALAGGVGEAARLAIAGTPAGVEVEVECATHAEVEAALDAGAARLLLDNMDPEELRRAVELAGGRARLEASGGVTLETVRAIAEAGVDFVSVGALTHSAPALDLSLIMEPL